MKLLIFAMAGRTFPSNPYILHCYVVVVFFLGGGRGYQIIDWRPPPCIRNPRSVTECHIYFHLDIRTWLLKSVEVKGIEIVKPKQNDGNVE